MLQSEYKMKKLFEALGEWAGSLSPANIILLPFLVILIFLIYHGCQTMNVVEVTPCSPEGNPGRCYYVNQQACETVWEKADATCKEFIKGLSLPPGRLIGPIVAKCQLSNLDKVFLDSRKSTPECIEMFKDLEGWRARNDIK